MSTHIRYYPCVRKFREILRTILQPTAVLDIGNPEESYSVGTEKGQVMAFL